MIFGLFAAALLPLDEVREMVPIHELLLLVDVKVETPGHPLVTWPTHRHLLLVFVIFTLFEAKIPFLLARGVLTDLNRDTRTNATFLSR